MAFVEFCSCVAFIIVELHTYIEVKKKLDTEESLLSVESFGKKLVDPLNVYTHKPNPWLDYETSTE